MSTIAFVLASWRPDAPAGMERAVAGHALGVAASGHQAIIVTADPTAPSHFHQIPVIHLSTLTCTFPSDDNTLRATITQHTDSIRAELLDLYERHDVNAAVYVDALWGLGRIMPTPGGHRRSVLALHVVGDKEDLTGALDQHPDAVIAPSPTVLSQAQRLGFDTSTWHLVPNSLMHDPSAPSPAIREQLRLSAPIRVLARLGPEKGITQLLAATTAADRAVEIALASAPFETATGSQRQLYQECQHLVASRPGTTLTGALPWEATLGWLGGACVVIVPSLAETFGLVALESLAAGTPVIAHDVGNLPALLGDGGRIVPLHAGPDGLWRAARDLLQEPVTYGESSRAAYKRALGYRPTVVADRLIEVVT